MEAWEDGQRVRPIPIEDDDGVPLPTVGTPPRARTSRHRRPWIPLAVSVIAVVVLISTVALFGAVEFQDAPATDPLAFSLTTIPDPNLEAADVLPPTLEETIPGITDRLTLMTTDGEAIWTFIWDPTFRVPKASAMMTPGETFWVGAAFDTAGRFVAARGAGTHNNGPWDVWIGTPSAIDTAPHVRNVWSTAWHATEVARLAYVREADNLFALGTVVVDLLTKSLEKSTLLLEFDQLPQIVRWDNDGFILQMGDQTVALDADGTELWSADGWAQTASPGFVPQVRNTTDGPRWYLIDRTTGEATSIADFGINNRAIKTEVVASMSNDIFGAATHRETGTTLTVIGPNRSAPRIVHLEGDASPYQFTSDAAFFILRSDNSKVLTFVDWRSGATHHFDVPDGQTVLAINLG